MQIPPNVPPPPQGFKELNRIIWSLIRPNRIHCFGGSVHLGTFGAVTCLTPKVQSD